MATCTQTDTSDFCPGVMNLSCLYVGFSYPDTWEFKDGAGAEIDITNDDFELEVYDSTLTLIHTLEIGTGLTVDDTNKLHILIGAPVTDEAGTYTHRLIRTEDATGARYPVIVGKIIVKA